MKNSLQFFVLILLFCIKFQTIYSSLFTSDQKNVFYIDDDQKYSWFDALTKCVSMNMSLATIDTKEKSDEITALLKKVLTHVFPLWIGAVANGDDRHFVWISNGKTVTFTNWYQGEPDFYNNNEYCLQTGWNDQWNDHECHKKFGFICEYNHNDLDVQTKLAESEKKLLELQKELDANQEKLQEELNKELQLKEKFDSNQDKLNELMIKEQQLQDALNGSQLLLQWFIGTKRPFSGNIEGNKAARNVIVNVN